MKADRAADHVNERVKSRLVPVFSTHGREKIGSEIQPHKADS
jgi:hypothetical protein